MNKALPELVAPFSWRRSGEIAWISFGVAGTEGAFSTRRGGVSSGRYTSLNLGDGTEDDLNLVRANQVRFRSAIDRDSYELTTVRQVHGDSVVDARDASREGNGTDLSDRSEADGLVTDGESCTLVVLIADCLPVALVTAESAAMIHCGWRGISSGIVNAGLKASSQVSGKHADEVVAFIGPGIGNCCYQVGEDVVSAISKLGHGDEVFGGGALDLVKVVRRELMERGVLQTNIHSVDLCTSCNEELFFSHRRDGITGRQGGSVWIV